jgi:hypothetical protein
MEVRFNIKHLGFLLFIVYYDGCLATGLNKTNEIEAMIYYIDSESGNDLNNGRSEEMAWKTFSALNSVKLNPGETVLFKRGSRFEGLLCITSSGNQNGYITFSDYGDTNLPSPAFTNKVFEQDNFGNCIRIKGSYVIIENLYFHNASSFKPGQYDTDGGWPQWEMGAIYIDKGARNCIVRNNEIFDCPVGIKSYGENALIENNFVHDCNRVLAEWDWGPLGIWLGADYQEVRNNRVFNYRAQHPNIRWNGADGGAFEVDDARYEKLHISIHHNYTRDCQGFLEITYKDVMTAPKYENFEIHHNISDDFQNFILLWQGAGFRIENNTIVRRKRNTNDKGVFNITGSDSRNLIRNNIIVVEKNIEVFFSGKKSRETNTIVQNNLFFAANDSLIIGYEGYGENPVFGNPLFVNYSGAASANDYALRYNSPAINKGLNLNYLTDFTGTDITQEGRADIGAFEFMK